MIRGHSMAPTIQGQRSRAKEEIRMEDYLTSPYYLTPPLSLIVKNHDGIEHPLVEMSGTARRFQSWCFVTDTPARQAELLAAVRQSFRGLRPEQIGVKTFDSLRELQAYVTETMVEPRQLRPVGAIL